MLIEVPCGNIESVVSAKEGGADRVELCSALSLGGLTPSAGMLEEIEEISILKFVIIRPREGDFIYSSAEFRSMLRDIELLRKSGAQGIVSGVLLKSGEIDADRTKTLIEVTHPLPFTFHRAFDLTPNPFRSLEILIEMKTDRLLTSGQATNAFAGREVISKLVRHSEDKIVIMAGAGINPDNVSDILKTGVKEIHLSGKRKKKNQMMIHHETVQMGDGDGNYYDVTDSGVISRIREFLI